MFSLFVLVFFDEKQIFQQNENKGGGGGGCGLSTFRKQFQKGVKCEKKQSSKTSVWGNKKVWHLLLSMAKGEKKNLPPVLNKILMGCILF